MTSFDAREMETLVGELINYDGQQRYLNKLEQHGCVTVADVRHAMNSSDKVFRQIGTAGWQNVRYALNRFSANEPLEDTL